MPELKTILVWAGGYVWRTLLLFLILVLAGLMLFISMVAAATAENDAADFVAAGLLNRSEHLPQFAIPSIPYVVPTLIVGLPFLITWSLKEHAVNQFKKSWTQSRTQACEYFHGRNQRRAGAVLWAALQLDIALVLPFGALGGLGNQLGLSPAADDIFRPEREVRYIAQTISQRIQFERPGLRPDGGFQKRGSNLPGGAADMLQQTVRELRDGPACGASVSLYGFSSNEKFDGVESHWKNLQLADHRAEAVYEQLLGLPETKDGWLVVKPPERWAPAIKPEYPQRAWDKMRSERNCRVQPGLTGDCRDADAEVQPGLTENCRNPDADRVVLLKWTLDVPCEVPIAAEETEPNDSG